MLQSLERKLAAVVADAVADRAHLDVTVAAGPEDPPAAGRAVARVAVASATPDRSFERDRNEFGTAAGATTSRRVLPLRFEARIAFVAVLEPDADAGARADVWARLLEDVSLVSHALDEGTVRAGAALGSGGDAGYDVQCFAVVAAALVPEPAVEGDDGRLRADLTCEGRATIWPPDSDGPRGVTRAVDVTLASVPLGLSTDAPVVVAGGTTRVRVRGVSGRRLVDLDGDREPLRLAVRVASDLPADQRGRIRGGEAGTVGGYRILPVGEPETVLTYEAPTGDLGTVREEQVEIRLASREGGPGVALGTIAIVLGAGAVTDLLGSNALFYASELPRDELLTLVSYTTVAQVPTPLDVLVFPPGGGTVDRELAVPALAGMDEVVVDTARLVLRGRATTAPTDAWSHTKLAPGQHLVALERPGRLVALVVDAPDPAVVLSDELHLVLCSATLEGAAWTLGPPLFAKPSFKVGDLYDNSLAGLSETPEAGGRLRIGVPPSPGQGWVLLRARGNNPAELAPLPIDTTVRAVTVAPSPDAVSLVLRGDPGLPGAGADDVLLWSHPSPVTADEGPLAVDLTPMARKRLSDRLAAVRDQPEPPLTLALPLRFTAASAGEIAVEERSLAVSYAVRAIGDDPVRTDLWGAWVPLALRAPGRIRPRDGRWTITARHLGRELNGPSEAAPPLPVGGLVVTAERWVALAVEVAPGPDGDDVDVALCALAARLAAPEPAEVVFELRADVAGRPGDALAAAAVANLDGGTDAQVVVDLGPGASVRPGTTVWATARANQGQVCWWAGAVTPGPARISTDRGVSWHLPEATMGVVEVPAVRLFHTVERPTAPVASLRVGDVALEPLPLSPVGDDPRELAAAGPVPAALLDALGRRRGSGSIATTLYVSSAAVLDLTVAELTLTYDPGAGPTPT